MFGVSPAYFISRFGDRFQPAQVAGCLEDIKAIGYDAYQLEVYHPETLDAWVNEGTARVVAAGERVGLVPSQFVAHFLLHGFRSPQSIADDFGLEEMERVVRMLESAPQCKVITVPLPGFETPSGGFDYAETFERCVRKLGRMAETAKRSGYVVGLEILPGAIVSGTDGFVRLLDALPDSGIGYNFDTGHAWAQKEPVEMIPLKLGKRITGTHLCDNDGGVNHSLGPGRGSINWDRTIGAIVASGYKGSWDVEIKCDPSEVEGEYRAALEYVRDRVNSWS